MWEPSGGDFGPNILKILSERPIVITPEQMQNRTRRDWPQIPRSKGVHVQAVNKALGVAAGKLSDDDADDFPFVRFSDTVYPLMPALGVAWEELRASMYAEHELVWQPYELCRDGIYGTPDGLMFDPERIWECKQTTKKAQSIGGMWMYLKQGLAYCAMSGLKQVQYDICFVLGDYSRPYQPQATETVVEFTEGEVESWWKIVKQAATRVAPE